MKLVCGKCGAECEGTAGTLGKKHQACGKRKKGSGKSRKDCGVWGTKATK